MQFTIEADYLGKQLTVDIEANNFNEAFDLASQVPKFLSIHEAGGKADFAPGGPKVDNDLYLRAEKLHAEIMSSFNEVFQNKFGANIQLEHLGTFKATLPKQQVVPGLISEDVAKDLLALQKHLTSALRLLPANAPSFKNITQTLSILSKTIVELKGLQPS